MNILDLPKCYRTRLLRCTNCVNKAPISSKRLAKLLNALKKDSVQDIHFCTSPELEKEDVCMEDLRKSEYVEILQERIPKVFESFVKYSGNFEFALFLDLWHGGSAKFNLPNMDERVFKFVEQNLSVGLMYLFGTDEDNLTLVVPDEFLKVVDVADRSMAGFHDYCKVCANLYGVCQPETIINKWNVDHRDSVLSNNRGKAAIDECSLFTRYFISFGTCVCNWSIETPMAMETVVEGRKPHKPYKPGDEEFREWLNYIDDINENLEEFKVIQEHFKKVLDNPISGRFNALLLLDDLRIGYEHPMALVERYREQIGFTKIDMDEITPIISAIMELNNKARLWVTYGNTPESLSAQPVVSAAANKVGRNDPCPCGSGLKYKKCCGKVVS